MIFFYLKSMDFRARQSCIQILILSLIFIILKNKFWCLSVSYHVSKYMHMLCIIYVIYSMYE